VVFGSACATVFAGTTYVVGLSMAPPPTYKVSDEQRINKFDEIADVYEKKTKKQEFYLGIGRWRRRILKDAEGRVLEVGAGTGSNLELYPPEKCDEVILCDRAPHMVAQTIMKIQSRLKYVPYRYPDYEENNERSSDRGNEVVLAPQQTDGEVPRANNGGCCASSSLHDGLLAISDNLHLSATDDSALALRNATIAAKQNARKQYQINNPTEHLPASRSTNDDLYSVACYPAEKLPFPTNSFDTVVDMFGLCSFDDPVKALLEMSRVCKPEGKILLLEHGKGSWDKLNNYLDKWAPRHASMWGCWWNRDIRRYLRLSGVQVVSREEKHFGTSQYIVLKPYKTIAELKALGITSSLVPPPATPQRKLVK
ncbi:methyltransferase, putative, partial [Bodo saltans]